MAHGSLCNLLMLCELGKLWVKTFSWKTFIPEDERSMMKLRTESIAKVSVYQELSNCLSWYRKNITCVQCSYCIVCLCHNPVGFKFLHSVEILEIVDIA